MKVAALETTPAQRVKRQMLKLQQDVIERLPDVMIREVCAEDNYGYLITDDDYHVLEGTSAVMGLTFLCYHQKFVTGILLPEDTQNWRTAHKFQVIFDGREVATGCELDFGVALLREHHGDMGLGNHREEDREDQNLA